MEEIVRERRPLRNLFVKLDGEIKVLLEKEGVDNSDLVAVKFGVLADTFEKLIQVDQKVMLHLRENPVNVEAEDNELQGQTEYKIKLELLRRRVEKLHPTASVATESVGDHISNYGENKHRSFKLPTVQIPKFNGALKDWLGYWAQFRKIHDDEFLHGSDKFFYLLQSLVPGTDPYKMVSSFPQTNENYQQAVDVLHKKYGDRDLLLQVYIQELLELIMTNASSKEKIPLKDLFINLDSHLRSLRTLKLEEADPSTWLFPLVQACLPKGVLYSWKRDPMANHDGSLDTPPRNRLELLMSFIEKEVDINHRVELTNTFTMKTAERRQDQGKKPGLKNTVPTLAGFHVGNQQTKRCLFCRRDDHDSQKCYKAKKMILAEKRNLVRQAKRCFQCFGKHFAFACKSDVRCFKCDGCHHTVMCPAPNQDKNVGEPPAKRRREDEPDQPITHNMNNLACSADVILQTIRVVLNAKGKQKEVRAFLDPGSHRSYVLKSTVAELQLEPRSVERATHALFGGYVTKSVSHLIYDVGVCSLAGKFEMMAEVRDQSNICLSLPNYTGTLPAVEEELRRKNLVLTDFGGDDPIELLIGGDLYGKVLTGRIEQLECGLTAIGTKFGYVITGELAKSRSCSAMYLNMQISDATIAKLWALDVIGITDPIEVTTAAEAEKLAKAEFCKTLYRKEDGRYVVRLPWKIGHPPLPSNKAVAIKRLATTIQKLKKMNLLTQYDKLLNDWELEGFIEEVTDPNIPGHYVPHRAVVKLESETTPVRPVFDASCKTGSSVSLNDCLQTGPNLLQKIPDVLIRFREKKVGFVSDIRKAFQMVEVATEDRDAMRFLWCINGDLDQLKEFRHARAMFGATSSPFILAAVLEHHLMNLPLEQRELGERLLKSFYVDNCVSSTDTVVEYMDFRDSAITLLKEIQMDLRMWFSTCDPEMDSHSRLPVLGLEWDRQEDTLGVRLEEMTLPETVTKRLILSFVQKIFDPIGFICPVIVPMKLLLQRAWTSKLKWDDPLPEKEAEVFRKWLEEVNYLRQIRIPRVITAGEADRKNWSLHTFVDASTAAFATIVFLRVATDDGVSVQLVTAKARISPLKKTTIPRLELLSCLIGARMAANVKRALDFDGVEEHYWTDSTTALAWITRHEPWATWVGNRVKEIRSLTSINQWRHVPGRENPADLPSRGCSPKHLQASQFWCGPQWLRKSEEDWPRSKEITTDEESIFSERSKANVDPPVTVVQSMLILDNLKCEYSLRSQFRILAWVRRFIANARPKTFERRTGGLSSIEIREAESRMWLSVQSESFPACNRGTLKGLEVLEDQNGMLRVKTRLTYRDDKFDFKLPIILPNNSNLVKQLIMETHREYCHAGIGFLLCKLREKYWIIHARKTIRRVVSKCFQCRRFSAKPLITRTAPLPLDRIKDAEVFQTTGIDLAGPLQLKNGKKIWLVIFTCAVYRAVHFSLVSSISSTAFIAVLKTFIQKFRRPDIIYCDNGTNFRGAANLFSKLNWEDITREERVSPIKFKFSPPLSQWYGGWWERLIGIAKELLKRSVGRGSLNRNELEIVIRDIAGVMNNRPLTYVSEDPSDLEPLTPSHFLNPLGKVLFPEYDYIEAESLRIRLNYVRTLRRELGNRFRKEYLSQLVSRNPKKCGRALKVGELVVVGSDGKKRLQWPLGRILELFPGRDGVSRVARVKTEGGELIRTVQRLYPLEMDTEDDKVQEMREVASRTRSGRVVKPPVRLEYH